MGRSTAHGQHCTAQHCTAQHGGAGSISEAGSIGEAHGFHWGGTRGSIGPQWCSQVHHYGIESAAKLRLLAVGMSVIDPEFGTGVVLDVVESEARAVLCHAARYNANWRRFIRSNGGRCSCTIVQARGLYMVQFADLPKPRTYSQLQAAKLRIVPHYESDRGPRTTGTRADLGVC